MSADGHVFPRTGFPFVHHVMHRRAGPPGGTPHDDRGTTTMDSPLLRPATPADTDAIAALMRASVLELFPRFYTAEQTASAAIHIADLDPLLIEDGTYFVHEAGGEVVACGAAARAEGFRDLVLLATLPGEPLYAAFGFTAVDRVPVILPDGTVLAGVEMRRPIE